mgnify:CR=1 FL=1
MTDYRSHITFPDSPRRIIIVDTEGKMGQAVEHLIQFDVLGFDTETYHAFDRDIPAFEPCRGARMRIAQFATPEGDTYIFDLFKISKLFLHYLFPNRFLCVIQNAKFELKFLMHELGIYEFGHIWDTLIAEQIISKGRIVPSNRMEYVPVGLDAIAKRRLGAVLPKDMQNSEWYREELTDRQLQYAARDANVVMPIYQVQREILKEQSQVRIAELEFATVPVIAWMENNGMTLNRERWLEVCASTQNEIEIVKQELWDILGHQKTLFDGVPTINLNSKKQVGAALENAGIELPLHPDTGEPTLSNKLLADSDASKFRAVELYIKYVKLAKRIQSYGPNWLDKINPYTGRIHCSLKQLGAETGRMSCNAPNLMQIPKDNLYRNCFEAQDGWVLVDCDYSQCELRILAEYCRDPNLLKAFDSDEDLHRFTAHLLYKTPLDEVTDKQRSMAKNMNFLMVYGGGAHKLSYNAGIPIETAEATMELYLKKVYPRMGDWLEERAKKVVYSMKASTMTGRIRQYMGNLNDKKIKSKIQRNAKNLPIQGTNADITKLALVQCYKALVKGRYLNDIRLLLPIHDEILTEAKPAYAELAYDLMSREMLDAERQYLHRVPSKVDGSITRVWCKDPSPEQLEEGRKIIRT